MSIRQRHRQFHTASRNRKLFAAEFTNEVQIVVRRGSRCHVDHIDSLRRHSALKRSRQFLQHRFNQRTNRLVARTIHRRFIIGFGHIIRVERLPPRVRNFLWHSKIHSVVVTGEVKIINGCVVRERVELQPSPTLFGTVRVIVGSRRLIVSQ